MTTNYVPNTNGKARKVMSLDEINHWFRVWGILGERRPKRLAIVKRKFVYPFTAMDIKDSADGR